MKKEWLYLGFGIVLIGLLGYIVSFGNSVRAFFWSDSFHYIMYVGLVIIFAFLLFFKKFEKYIKNPMALLFIPIAFMPMMKCLFKVPFIFCSVCRRCPWGTMRPVLMPSVLLMNVDKRYWCYKVCPVGYLQDLQTKVFGKKICLPCWVYNLRYLVLAFVAVIVVLTYITASSFPLEGGYRFMIPTIVFFILMFIVSFFVPRFWCNMFCPIGSFSDIVLKIRRKFNK